MAIVSAVDESGAEALYEIPEDVLSKYKLQSSQLTDSVKAQIKVKMGAMSLTYVGTVSVIEQDPEQHRAVLQVKSRESRGQGHANADVTFSLSDGGGTIHTAAQITGKAASMGEGVMVSVLDALIKNFTQKLSSL